MKKEIKKPAFGEWISVNTPPALNKSVLVCRQGQGESFEAFRVKRKKTDPAEYPKYYWTNTSYNFAPIVGITHWMNKPIPYGMK